MFHCPNFVMEKGSLNQALGKNVSSESIAAEMLRSKKNWPTVSSAIIKIQTELVRTRIVSA